MINNIYDSLGYIDLALHVAYLEFLLLSAHDYNSILFLNN